MLIQKVSGGFLEIPGEIAICPECGGNLRGLPNVLVDRGLFVGVTLWKPEMLTLFCHNEETIEHEPRHGELWFDVYDLVAWWCEEETVLVVDNGTVCVH